MVIDTTTSKLPDDQYFKVEQPKDMIMLHFTAGSKASHAYNAWINQRIKIGTAYIVDKDGSVYEVFNPKYWAYHLGIKGKYSQSWKHDKRSIGIEIVNMGPLKLRGKDLCCWPNDFNQKFCSINDTHKYVETSYRGYDFYEAFPQVQLDSVVKLVDRLSNQFQIKKTLPPVEKQMECDLEFYDSWKGIAAHQNVRPDKFDIGPAFDWNILT